jgi:hypothetical protein
MGEDTVRHTRKDLLMAAKGLALLATVGVAAFSIGAASIAAANAASPPGTPAAAGMTITVADVPGAKVAAQGKLTTSDPDVANAYSRVFTFASPYGASKYIYLKTEVLITTSLDNAATEYHLAGHEFSSKAGQNALVKSFVSGLGPKNVKSISKITPRALGFGDSALEVGSVVHTKVGVSVNISVSLYRVGKVVVVNIAAGRGAKINAADARKFGKLGVARIDAGLIPILVSPATITGTAQQGQTLTATNGTWGDEPDSFAYQWQHCDAAGANCTDIASATASTYAVTAADVGFTLHVEVKATNRFGSTTSTSAVTAAVT